MTKRKLVSTVMISATLSGCTVGPNYHPQSASALQVPEVYAGAAQHGVVVNLATWWDQFDDPLLSQWIGQALAQNNDVDTARARLRASRASLQGARGVLLPSLSATGGTNRQDQIKGAPALGASNTSATFQAGLDASWEADLFGGNKWSLEASKATSAQAQASLYDVQRSVTAELALNYITARNVQARLAIAQDNLHTQDDMIQIAAWREQAGLVSALDVEQVKVLRAQTAANIPQLEQNYAAAANRIAVLTGQAPGSVTTALNAPKPIPLAPDAVEAGLPAQLLHRRPDVLAAEDVLRAQTAQIGVTEAQLYPALQLSGTLTSASLSAASFGGSIISNLVSSLTAPIFEGGQLRAQVRSQRATADAALASYRGTVLTALEDVENALVVLDKAKAMEVQYALAEKSSQTALTYARSQYQTGLIDFQSLLDTERTALSSEDSYANARAARATAAVQLYKALGGGWSPADISAEGSK